MSAQWTLREKLAAVVMVVGTVFLFVMAFRFADRSAPYRALFFLGGAFGLLSVAFTPHELFQRVTFQHFKEPQLHPRARLCQAVAGGCFLLAALSWLLSHEA